MRRALRTASAAAFERIAAELGTVAEELAEAQRRAAALDADLCPFRITSKPILELIDQMTCLVEHAPLETRVAWGRDRFERIDIDMREEHALAVGKATNDEAASRSDSVTEWLRRAGAGRLLIARGKATTLISLPPPARSRAWLKVASLECERCDEIVERRSPVQRHCLDCRASLKRARSREAVARTRHSAKRR